MTYARPTLNTVTGIALVLIADAFLADTADASWFLILGMVYLAGLALAVYGLFTGTEAAVDAGWGQDEPGSTE